MSNATQLLHSIPSDPLTGAISVLSFSSWAIRVLRVALVGFPVRA